MSDKTDKPLVITSSEFGDIPMDEALKAMIAKLKAEFPLEEPANLGEPDDHPSNRP